jgi:hypothetical protein
MRFYLILLLTVTPLFSWPLDSVFSRVTKGLDVEWVATAYNTDSWFYTTYGTKCTGENDIYKSCDFIADSTYLSIAYSYGGEDSDSLFLKKLDSGFSVGSHLCHYETYGDPSDTIAGTDCSGYISWLWNVPRQSTRGFYSNSDYLKVDRDSIIIGDALVKPGSHIVLVIDIDTVNSKLLIVESTSAVNGVRQRLIDVNDDYWLAYFPIRYPKIGEPVAVDSHIYTSLQQNITIKNRELLGISKGSIVTIYSLNGRELQNLSVENNSFRISNSIRNLVVIISIQNGEKQELIKSYIK